MSTIRNIQLTLPDSSQRQIQQGIETLPSRGACQISIQTHGPWIVTGEYRDNLLCAITIKRTTNQETG
jgi:hypothetical protein